jgi:predicted transcriptional regulator
MILKRGVCDGVKNSLRYIEKPHIVYKSNNGLVVRTTKPSVIETIHGFH